MDSDRVTYGGGLGVTYTNVLLLNEVEAKKVEDGVKPIQMKFRVNGGAGAAKRQGKAAAAATGDKPRRAKKAGAAAAGEHLAPLPRPVFLSRSELLSICSGGGCRRHHRLGLGGRRLREDRRWR